MPPDSEIVVFDGMCNLCGGVVDFITAHDPRDEFTFVPMQSPRGQQLLEAHGVSIDQVDTFLLIGHGGALGRSDAAIAVAARLIRPWNLLTALRFVPRPIRDRIYSFVARNRYRWFGKRATCKLPG